MKKLWSLLALVLVLVLLGVSYGYIKAHPKKVSTPEITETTNEQLLKLDAEKINKMILTTSKGDLIFEKKEKDWVVPGVTYNLIQANITSIAGSFADLSAEKVIEETPTDLDKYGLKTPTVTAKAILQGGEEKVVYLGNKTAVGDSYYLMVKGGTKVYTIAGYTGDYFTTTLSMLRDTAIENKVDITALNYLKIVPVADRVIEIVTNTVQSEADKEYQLNQFSMVKPYKDKTQIDSTKLQAAIQALPNIAVSEVVEDNPKDLSKYGLDKPSLEVVAKDSNDNSLHILVGKDKDENLTYFMLADSNIVYTGDKLTLRSLNFDPFTVISKLSYIVNIDDVDKIDITANGKKHIITLTRTLTKKAEKAEDKDEYATVYKVDDKEIVEDAFKKYYQTIIGIIIDAENDKKVEQKDEVTTTFYFNKGSVKQQTVTYSPYNENFYAIFINGNSEFLASKDKVNKMISETEALLK